jgi:magnesium and cobalt exporter, CNNM family
LILEIIFSLVFIFIASFLSVAEISIASFGMHKIEELREKNDKSVPSFEFIQKNPDNFFGTVQLLSVLSILISVLLGYDIIYSILFACFGSGLVIVSIAVDAVVFSILVLVLVTLIPKVVGSKYAERIGRLSVKTIILLVRIFHFPVKCLTILSNLILSPLKEKTSFSQMRMSEDEIRYIISEGVETGALDETEKEIIENVFEFNDLRANEVMVSRTEIKAVDIAKSKNEIRQQILDIKYSLLPVCEESIDNIVGVLHTKDVIKLFVQNEEVNIKSSIRPAYYVPSMKLISEILKDMQNRGERLVIVTDEYGGTEGLITMEDILEEIVGEFADNKGTQPEFVKTPNGNYTIIGTMTIDDFNQVFNYQLPASSEYNTVAGFIAEQTGKILNQGETYQYEALRFELIKKIRQKMVQFRVNSINNDLAQVTND